MLSHHMMTSRLLTVTASLAMCASLQIGCKTQNPHPTQDQDTATSSKTTSISEQDALRYFSEAKTLRDRPDTPPPTFVAHAQKLPDEVIQSTRIPESVQRTAAIWHLHLNAKEIEKQSLLNTANFPTSHLAIYVADKNELHYVSDHGDKKRIEQAIKRAAVQKIDLGLMPPQEPSPTMDRWLARKALVESNASVIIALQKLQAASQTSETLDPMEVSKTPSLLWEHPSTRPEPTQNMYGSSQLLDASQTFTQIEGMSFIAALLRAHGWSGVEIALTEQPQGTSQVLLPESWATQRSKIQVSLPESFLAQSKAQGWQTTSLQQGQVGPMWLKLWLASAWNDAQTSLKDTSTPPSEPVKKLLEVGDQSLQVLPLSWRADQWFQMTHESEDETYFVWISQWDAPTSAIYVAKMMNAAIQLKHQQQPNLSMKCMAVNDGLQVATLCSNHKDAHIQDDAALLSKEARVQYLPEKNLLFSYRPSTMERLNASTKQMTLEQGEAGYTWTDPGLNLTASLEPVRDYKPQLTQTGLVRWFATGNGVTMQLSSEPRDPLMPGFESPEYGNLLSDRILKTLPTGKLRGGQLQHHDTLGPMHVLSFEIKPSDQQPVPYTIHLWHLKRDDVVITLSVNAPDEAASKAKESASQVLKSMSFLNAN